MRRGLRISGNRGNFVRFEVVNNHICLVVHDREIVVVRDKEIVRLCESLLKSLSDLDRDDEKTEHKIRKVLNIAADVARIAADIASILEKILSKIQ